MSKTDHSSSNRREFFSASVRYLALGGLTAYAVGQGIKARRLSDDPNCIKLYTCSDCVEFSGCKLPKAAQFKSESRRSIG